jgi:CBS domain-containing protein
VQIKDIMRTEFHAFNINDTLASACESMDRFKLYGAPVVDNQGIIHGIFTRPHLIRALIEKRDPLTLVQELMQPSILTLEPENDISEAIKRFVETGYRHYPVKDGSGRLVGLVLSSDLMQVGAQELYRIFGTHRLIKSRKSRLVAAITLTSTLMVLVPPSLSNSNSCKTRNSLDCILG